MANLPIKTYKGTSSYLSTIANTNGNLLFDTDKKEIFLDDGTNRESYGGGSATVISYADFSQLTPQQQESGNYLVTGMPALTNAYNVEYKNGVDVGTELDNLNTDLNNKTETTSNSIGTLAINQNQTMTTDCLLVCNVSISANVQYAGYSIKINNLVVDGYGVISTPSPSLSLYSSYRLNKGDVVYVEQNTGTTVTAKIYSN